jgi:hypothetical protein
MTRFQVWGSHVQRGRLILALALLGSAVPASAQTPAGAAQPQITEQNLYRWTAPTPAEQLKADTTAVPSGMGAVFVPAMTKGMDEPEVLVYQGTQRVAHGQTGKRIVLTPGSYTLRVGSAPLDQMLSVPVQVTAGNTTTVPVNWGALVIEVVDGNNVPHRGTYELIQVSDKQPYTTGFGADTLLGESIRTILVAPGLYRIVRPGSNYRARTDFSTVVVPESAVVYYKLVQDPDTGTLLGAGVVPPEEIGIVTEASGWTKRFSIGFGLPIADTSNVVGTANQTSIGFSGTFDNYINYNKDKNYFASIFELEEGFVHIDPEQGEAFPLQKIVDRLRYDAIYTRFLNPRVGPYVRFGLLTNLFENNVLVTEPTTVVKHFLDGSTTVDLVPANRDFNIGPSFGPVLLREGAGINVRLIRGRVSSLDWRGGIGFRQSLYRGAFVLDRSEPNLQEFSEVDSFNEEGVETTIVGTLRLGRLLGITNLDLFADFNTFDEPTVDWRNTLSWRLTGELSLDYRIDLLRQPQVSDRNQITQSLQFRYSWGN